MPRKPKLVVYDHPLIVRAHYGEVYLHFYGEYLAMAPETARLLADRLIKCAESTATLVARKEATK